MTYEKLFTVTVDVLFLKEVYFLVTHVIDITVTYTNPTFEIGTQNSTLRTLSHGPYLFMEQNYLNSFLSQR